MLYFVKTPVWLQKLFTGRIWRCKGEKKTVYLTFDDGPHPIHTMFVLDELKKFNAKATFFCIGKNVALFPDIYNRILKEGHAVGNHTYNHLKGSKTSTSDYVADVERASNTINSQLFRPPYGKLKRFQEKILREGRWQFKVIMWTVLSGDFDTSISPQRCLENVLLHSSDGDIIVFHDSEKAAGRMRYALPKVLESFAGKNILMKALSEADIN